MISIDIDAKQLKRLRKATAMAGKKFPRELAAAVNSVAKKTRINIGRRIRQTINLKKAVAERPIKIKKVATAETPVGVVSIDRERREGLQHFGARQTGKGVTYKIDKRGGRKLVAGAFMGPRPGVLAPKLYGGVWKRQGEARKMTKGRHEGRIRQPIVKLYGVSPYGAYAKNDMSGFEVQFINKGLRTEMERRIKLNILRASGLVSK
jgi:hypothetical protein